jgi:hypothetical protein
MNSFHRILAKFFPVRGVSGNGDRKTRVYPSLQKASITLSTSQFSPAAAFFKKSNGGFIFLMTLCFILIISILLITSLQQILLYQKGLTQQEEQHQQFYQLEHLARQLSDYPNLAIEKNCLLSEKSANQSIEELLDHKACSLVIQKKSYRYLLEDLGDFPCLVLHEKRKKRASHHWRVSIVSFSDDESTASALQIRSIKASKTMTCTEEEHRVNEGISSWRYFTITLKKVTNQD